MQELKYLNNDETVDISTKLDTKELLLGEKQVETIAFNIYEDIEQYFKELEEAE